MYRHEPPGYVCPFCLLVAGVENEQVRSRQSDIILQTDSVTAFVGTRQWPNTQGHVLVVPNTHYENLYELPDDCGAAIFAVSKRVAVAMKEVYGCAGISTRQHNEPAGNQEVWHYHLHVFPRFAENDLYPFEGAFMDADTRASYAARLRAFLEK